MHWVLNAVVVTTSCKIEVLVYSNISHSDRPYIIMTGNGQYIVKQIMSYAMEKVFCSILVFY